MAESNDTTPHLDTLNLRKTFLLLVVTCLVVALLFEVTFVLEFGGSAAIDGPDPAREAQFDLCYQEKDNAMHKLAFGTIDNPDVQREFISANRVRIARECREQYPQQIVQLEQQSEMNLIDLSPRFW